MSNILILGASYGSLLAAKLALAGHRVRLVCSAPTAALINRDGIVVRFPAEEVRSTELAMRGGREAALDDSHENLHGLQPVHPRLSGTY